MFDCIFKRDEELVSILDIINADVANLNASKLRKNDGFMALIFAMLYKDELED